jgi:myo-inositol-1(or 4)-monophosphatase
MASPSSMAPEYDWQVPSELVKYAGVACHAVAEATQVARRRFGGAWDASPKGPKGDLVTAVDRECDELIVSLLQSRFPRHTIVAEESGRHAGDDEWTWLVDPLDGTNNFAVGLPLYGSAVTLCHNRMPVVSALAEAHSGDIAHAIRGSGVWMNDSRFSRPTSPIFQRNVLPATALWVGYATDFSEPALDVLTRTIFQKSRRVFSSWAPTIDTMLFLRGGIDAVAIYGCSGLELLGSLLVIEEAGGLIRAPAVAPVSLLSLPRLAIAGERDAVESLIVSLPYSH